LGATSGFPLGEVWGDRAIHGMPFGRWKNELTGEVLEVTDELPLSRAQARFPLALLVKEGS
jgi:maltooligosyltrehalose synthase